MESIVNVAQQVIASVSLKEAEMSKHIKSTKLSETLTISESTDGFWLYDKTRGMNLSMRAKTEQDAYVECITYCQKRFAELEGEHSKLTAKVDAFVSQFVEEHEED